MLNCLLFLTVDDLYDMVCDDEHAIFLVTENFKDAIENAEQGVSLVVEIKFTICFFYDML